MFENIIGNEPHPVVEMPDQDCLSTLTEEKRNGLWQLRRNIIVGMLQDPLQNGYEPEIWKLADARLEAFRNRFPVGVITELDLGGNRSSKTERKAKRLVQNMLKHDGWKAWACQSTEAASIQNQQSVIYKYLPNELKPTSGKLRKGVTTKIVYSQAGGFTENVLVLPNGSECRFKFYEMDVKNQEGADLNEVWADELVTPEWIEAFIFRLVTKSGLLGITFAPIEGYNATVKLHLNGAVTTEEVYAELLPKRDAMGAAINLEVVPRVQENLNVEINGQRAKALIIYFHTNDNPFGNYESMKATLEGASKDKILTRVYGVPTKSMETKFPLFKDSVHVVSLNRFREIQKEGGSWYHFLDPCSGRNWFQLWIFIDRIGRAFVVGESPSTNHQWAYIPGIGDPGPWTVAGNKADGDMGDGQKEWGWGYTRYLEEIDRMERILSGDLTAVQPLEGRTLPIAGAAQKISISARWIDARYGNARKTSEERSVTMIEELRDLGMDFLAAPSEKYIDGGHGGGDGSLRMINGKLFYDVNRPVDLTNSPKLFCVETVPNTIYSLKEWTSRDGQHGASKDPIDCLRMYVLSGVEYVDESLMQPRMPWMNQFKR